MDGRLDTLARDDALESLDRVLGLQPLLPHVSDQWWVIWEGAPLQKGAVRTLWAGGGTRQIPGAPRPPDAPELNPTEGVWQPLKQGEMGTRWCRHLTPLHSELGLAMKRWRRKPRLGMACCTKAGFPRDR